MPIRRESKSVRIDARDAILDAIEAVSPSLYAYVDSHPLSRFVLWSKNLFHSDLVGKGKQCGPRESLSDNILYYMSEDEMREVADRDGAFPDAKQSNIGFPLAFYADCGCPTPRQCPGNHFRISEHHDVFLVNDTLNYFTIDQTNDVLRRLGKSWTCSGSLYQYEREVGEYTRIDLTEAVHGIGTSEDVVFSKLRLSMFQGDSIYVLIEKTNGRNKIFIALLKNPRFFNITGLADRSWVRHLEGSIRHMRAAAGAGEPLPIQEERSRKLQSQWKRRLAEEMMTYTSHEGEIMCPFTWITASFESVPMLFIASHIKAFSKCTNDEAFDINNGLLLCSNADALFDKHMITVDENKNLVFSYKIRNDIVLQNNLKLGNRQVFASPLNENRMQYMMEHRRIFNELELRRRNGYDDEEMEEDTAVHAGEYPELQMQGDYLMAATSDRDNCSNVIN